MPESIKVGSAEFQMLMNLPEFRKAVEQDAPAIARSGSQKVAAELEKGAKQGSDVQIREAKRASLEVGRTSRASATAINAALAVAFAGATAAIAEYGEHVQKTVALQNQLNALTGQSGALKDFTELSGAFDRLGKAGANLAATFGTFIAPEMTHLINLLARGTETAERFIRALGGIRVQEQADQLIALQEANSEAAKKERQAVAETAKTAATAAQEKSRAQIAALDKTRQRVQEQATDEKQRIGDVRDAKLKAVDDQERAALRALADEEQAASDLIKNQIANAELVRDRRIAAVEHAKDAALRAFDLEERARADARRDEDRLIEQSTDRERRAIDQRHTAAMRAFDRERDAIGRRRDTALAAIDDERDAEERRHTEALDNLDRERDARLGIIDEQLRALSDQERAESRAERARSLQQQLGEAKGDLSQARRSGDPESVRRAQQAVNRAQQEIRREERNNQRDDLRQSLEDQKDAIRQEIEERRRGEQAKTDEVKTGLEARAEAVRSEAQQQLDELELRKQRQSDANAAELQAFQETLKAKAQALADARLEEDRAFEDRKQRIADNAAAEVAAIRAAYDDPVNGIIPALQRQEQAISRSFDQRKLAIQDAARVEQEQIRQTANYQLRALDIMTRNLFQALERQKQYWTSYANYAQSEARRAAGAVNQPQVPVQQQQPQYTTNYGVPVRPPVQQPPAGEEDWRSVFRRFGLTVPGMARGGWVTEPTLLVSGRTGRVYGRMAEAGPEEIVPAGARGVTISMPVHVNGASIRDQDRLATVIVDRAVTRLATLLTSTQITAGTRVPNTIPGAM